MKLWQVLQMWSLWVNRVRTLKQLNIKRLFVTEKTVSTGYLQQHYQIYTNNNNLECVKTFVLLFGEKQHNNNKKM